LGEYMKEKNDLIPHYCMDYDLRIDLRGENTQVQANKWRIVDSRRKTLVDWIQC
jgi:hypothetical protein